MKIRFKEDVGFTLTDVTGYEMDETFHAGDEHEGAILYDAGDYVSFVLEEGWQIHGLKKSQFEVIETDPPPVPDGLDYRIAFGGSLGGELLKAGYRKVGKAIMDNGVEGFIYKKGGVIRD